MRPVSGDCLTRGAGSGDHRAFDCDNFQRSGFVMRHQLVSSLLADDHFIAVHYLGNVVFAPVGCFFDILLSFLIAFAGAGILHHCWRVLWQFCSNCSTKQEFCWAVPSGGVWGSLIVSQKLK